MPVVSVINYKGGVGKTTLTANLGAELAFRGKKVLLIDLDPQASLTFSLVEPDYWRDKLAPNKTIKRWYDSLASGASLELSSLIFEPPKLKRALPVNGGLLHLIPSHLGLINVDLELATELGGGTLKQNKLKYLRVHRRLSEGLLESSFDRYDVILIDCPPNFNVVTKTAIVASQYVLIPAKPDYLSTMGIDFLITSLDELVANYNEYAELEDGGADVEKINPDILGVVFTMTQMYADRPIAAQRQYMNQTSSLGVQVFANYVRENKTLYGDAPREGVPVVMKPSAGMGKVIVSELEALVNEISNKLGI
ncbi:ParA family protein [Streptomyces bungoensis]|uniref:ParA family protein n=1 Tax=Streptomyces bungoensis TaxID=285568 RepID=UPI00099EE87A|nr:AAA family ATPase [Streptomyces bungoensis]